MGIEGGGASAPVPLIVLDFFLDIPQIAVIEIVAFQGDHASEVFVEVYVVFLAVSCKCVSVTFQIVFGLISCGHLLPSLHGFIIHNNTQKSRRKYTKIHKYFMGKNEWQKDERK